MFCVLNCEKKRPTLLEKIFPCLLKEDYSLNTIPVYKGAPFFMLDVAYCKEINWENVIASSGKCARHLLVCDNISVPENEYIGVFSSNALYSRVFQNTVIEMLRNNNTHNNRIDIAVSDSQGKYIDFIRRLVPFASSLSVITENKRKYLDLCDEVIFETGLCISVLSDFNDAKIKINTNKNTVSIRQKNSIMNISGGESPDIPEIYKNIAPLGINEMDFYSALYELCGVFALGDCVFQNVTINYEKKPVKALSFS